MVNRIIQAKKFKMSRRGKKRPWSSKGQGQVKVTSNISPIIMDEYRARVRSLADPGLVEVVNKRYPLHATPPGQVEAQAARWRMLTKTPEMMCFTLNHTSARRIRLFFNAPKTIWMFQEELFLSKKIRRSIEYSSKERAIKKLDAGKVIWVEETPLTKIRRPKVNWNTG